MIGDAPRSKTTGVPGWHTLAEEEFYLTMAQRLPFHPVIVCVGCEYGRCVSEFYYGARDKEPSVYAVDLFPENHHLGNLYDIFVGNMMEAGVEVAMIRGDSAKVGEQWSGKKIDLLLIDAGHAYEEVVRDIAAWTPHVKPGGMVIFHDYAHSADAHYLHHEVKRAVDGWIADHKMMLFDGPDSVVYTIPILDGSPLTEEEIKYAHEVILPMLDEEITGVPEAFTPEAQANMARLIAMEHFGIKEGDFITDTKTGDQLPVGMVNREGEVVYTDEGAMVYSSHAGSNWDTKPVYDYDTAESDDLTKIKGIGAKTQEVLNAIEIYSYSDLAHANPNELVEVTQKSLATVQKWIEDAKVLYGQS